MYRIMKRHFFLLGVLFFVFMLCCCNDNKSASGAYDPGKPTTIAYFTPDTGRVAEKVIIKGSNFGDNKTAVSVFFTDSTGKDNYAAVVGVNNETIYCIAPRQAQGNNTITVIVSGGDPVQANSTFKYKVSENVSTVAGDFTEYTTGTDGTLAEATFGQMFGVACIDKQSGIIGQAWGGNSTRYVSIDEDAVITIQAGTVLGKPTATKDGSKVYGAQINGSNTVYIYDKLQAWVPSRLTEITSGTDVWAVALNGTDEWLYYVSSNGRLGRIEVGNPRNNEVIFDNYEDFSGSPFSYIAYSAYEDCFYVATDKNKILKVKLENGSHVYEQINQNLTGTEDGYLAEAKFQHLRGLTVDEDGNIYVCQGGNHVIRKITLNTGYVSTPLGTVNVSGNDDGGPDVALFNSPQDISYDGDGGFWIAQRYNPALRKYAVE